MNKLGYGSVNNEVFDYKKPYEIEKFCNFPEILFFLGFIIVIIVISLKSKVKLRIKILNTFILLLWLLLFIFIFCKLGNDPSSYIKGEDSQRVIDPWLANGFMIFSIIPIYIIGYTFFNR